MSAKALANELKPFDIFPASDGLRRGYSVGLMIDAFRRYLPPQCVNASEPQSNRGFSEISNVSMQDRTDTLKNDKNQHGMGTTDTLTDQEPDFPARASAVDPEGWTYHLNDQRDEGAKS